MRARSRSASSRATVVLPVPGGPQRIIEAEPPAATMRPSVPRRRAGGPGRPRRRARSAAAGRPAAAAPSLEAGSLEQSWHGLLHAVSPRSTRLNSLPAAARRRSASRGRRARASSARCGDRSIFSLVDADDDIAGLQADAAAAGLVGFDRRSTTTPRRLASSMPSSSATAGDRLATVAPAKRVAPAELDAASRGGSSVAARSATVVVSCSPLAQNVKLGRRRRRRLVAIRYSKRLRIVDRLAVDVQDHVAGLQARPRSAGPWRCRSVDQHAGRRAQPERCRRCRGVTSWSQAPSQGRSHLCRP